MTTFFISDLHVDFYAPLTRTVSLLRRYFQEFFERNFLPADVCCIAGDIANNYFTYVEFLRFISEKYSQVFVCLGNHDVICERAGVFGADRDFATSESKIDFFLAEAARIRNVYLLENAAVDGFAGCMGMCDFSYRHAPDANAEVYRAMWRARWFDGRHWNYKNNDTFALWRHYDSIMNSLTLQKPKVMMTHFLPIEFGMARCFGNDPCSTYFYFQGDPFLRNMEEGSIWQAGHTHTAIKKVVHDSTGKSHLLLCNPVGYPDERPYLEYGLRREDFLLEV